LKAAMPSLRCAALLLAVPMGSAFQARAAGGFTPLCGPTRASRHACSSEQTWAQLQTEQHLNAPAEEHLAQTPQLEISSSSAGSWGGAVARAAMCLLTTVAISSADVHGAAAENELALLASQKSTAELVKPECFATSCKSQIEACASDGDCMKGLACTAKCMGDSQCTVGCFARYSNQVLEQTLQCTIEDAGCIQIATQTAGADSPYDAPLAPRALVKASPAKMQGKWYKVLGFNPNYDCYECQRNSFTADGDTKRAAGREVGMDIGPKSAIVEVEYTMPRERIGMAPETFRAKLEEKLEFDSEPGSRRTAHTEGRMFGLTFWENWYLIGENTPKEPEFRFVYYTGKTVQNRYEGAFVFARKPELPDAAMPNIYKIARDAGLEPTRACRIDNSCFEAPQAAPQRPLLFTPVAAADTMEPVPTAASSTQAPAADLFSPVRSALRDVAEIFEDPKPAADALFARQRFMSEVREYDANGFRVPTGNYYR